MSEPQNDHVWECSCDECRNWLITAAKAQGAAEATAAVVADLERWSGYRFSKLDSEGGLLLAEAAKRYASGDHIKQETKPNE